MSSSPVSVASVGADAPPSAHAPADGENPARQDQGVFHGQNWTYRNGFDTILAQTPLALWQDPHAAGWQRVKRNARREVWRASIAGAVYYLKYYRANDWPTRLKGSFRSPACESEWRSGIYALQAAIPAVPPAGFTTRLKCRAGIRSLLVTEAVEPSYPLEDFWTQIRADEDAARRQRDTAQLTELLGEMIAHAHQAGFQHADMHAANILVQPVAPGRYRTLFVDLHSARLGVPIRDQAVVRNLAQLNQWFRRHSSLSQRLRFLRAYLRWRNEYEPAFDHARPLKLSFRALVRALADVARRHAERLGARRDRRARRDGRYFARLRVAGGWRALAVVRVKRATDDSPASQLVLEPAWWRRQLANPLRWFQADHGQSCKNSHSASVRRALLEHETGKLPVIVKRPLARNWRRRISQLVGTSRSLRGWRMGHALLHRHVPAARPLAVLERRVDPFTRDSLLITEAIPGGMDLETHLRKTYPTRTSAAWWLHKRSLCELVARQLRNLEQAGFVHRDCKASNLLMTPAPRPKLLWIDMDGLARAGRRPSRRRRTAALVRLHVSLLDVPGLTRTDRARFLKSYCARFGASPRDWRRLWRDLTPAVNDKIRAKEVRRQWKLKHYGRK